MRYTTDMDWTDVARILRRLSLGLAISKKEELMLYSAINDDPKKYRELWNDAKKEALKGLF